MAEVRKCARCGERKPLEEFQRDKRKPAGRGYRCLPCRRRQWKTEYGRRYRASHAEALKERSRAWRQIADLQATLKQAQEERDDARGHWTRAEQGWNRVILQAEGFQRDYLSAIERAEDVEEQLACSQRDCSTWHHRAEAAERERDERWTEAEAKDEVAEVLEVAAIHVSEAEAERDEAERDAKAQRTPTFNFWKALRIWDMGKDYEKQGCRCCIASWKPGEPAEHAEDCCFHPAPAERPWR